MQTCPVEILDHIFSYLPLFYDKPYAHHRYPYSACSAACRILAQRARSFVFKTVKLDGADRGDRLRGLLRDDPGISGWIKELHIGANEADDDSSWKDLPRWLSTADGSALISQLNGVQVLKVARFSGGDRPQTLDRAWQTLWPLRSVMSLVLQDCELPSEQMAWRLITEAYPDLATLHIHNVDTSPLERRITAALDVDVSSPLKLRNLTLVTDTGDPLPLYTLFGRLRCPSLTTLHISSIHDLDFEQYTFHHAKDLVAHAPCLERLELRGHWDMIVTSGSVVNLGLAHNLWSMTFNDMGDDSGTTSGCQWYAQTLLSLPAKTKLRYVEFSVGSRYSVHEDTWISIDKALSDPRFECKQGTRTLVIKNERQIPRRNSFYRVRRQRRRTLRELLSHVQTLGWFKIVGLN